MEEVGLGSLATGLCAAVSSPAHHILPTHPFPARGSGAEGSKQVAHPQLFPNVPSILGAPLQGPEPGNMGGTGESRRSQQGKGSGRQCLLK